MPSELDRRIDEAVAALTAPGAPFAFGEATVDGEVLRTIVDAPPTLPALFARAAALHASRTFLVAGPERLSFAAVHDAAAAVAGRLRIASGERVGIALPNAPAWVVAYMAVLMAGGIVVPLNTRWREGELAASIAQTGCGRVIADGARAEPIGRGDLVVIDPALPLAEAIRPLLAGATRSLPTLGPDDPATILFTSGSAGACRGVLSDHRAKVQAALGFVLAGTALARATRPARHPPAALLTVPLFHVTGEVALLLASLAAGRKLVMMPRWDAGEAARLIAAERITWFTGVPLMGRALLDHPARGRFDLSSLTDLSCGGAARPPGEVAALATGLGVPPAIGYGLTETNALGCSNARGNYRSKPASVGRPSPLADMALVEPLGEVAIRSVANARRYWDSAAALAPGGWLPTGDLGRIDVDGYLYLVGRAKELIIRGGENVAPAEVEGALLDHPAVVEAAVLAAPDPHWGEVPVAVVHPRGAVSPEALIAFVSARLARFKVPARVWLSPEPLPRLGSGKIDRAALAARYLLPLAASAG